MRLFLIAFALLALLTTTARAQMAATLVADSVTVPAGGRMLVAEGNVEIFYGETRLSARRIAYNGDTDQLQIEGPIFLQASDGSILTADAASLDPQLRNGILLGARLVLNEQLQMAATQINQVEGRYTQLYQVAATSCHICAEGQTPLWEIRARRVVHDAEEHQLYFDNATLRLAGVPVFWLPQMRLPDPTLQRATGLLIPSLTSTDTLGTGLKLPYFIRLGDHRDLMLTPYLSTSTTTLEAQYRQAFLRGDLQINGALTRDDLFNDTRGYVFAEGLFDLGEEVVLRFDLEATNDNAYLRQYGYSDKDRLDSELSLERIRDRDMTRAALTYFTTLRSDETNSDLPPLLGEFIWERRIFPSFGGRLTLQSDLQAHYRNSESDVAGRDVARLGFGAAWHQTHVTQNGLVMDGTLGFDFDLYSVADDSVIGNATRSTVFAQTTLRYPLMRSTPHATHIIEPVLQLAWSDTSGDPVANEDSTASEFDEANLLSMSRFAGQDSVEVGGRAALGVTWTRTGTDGWSSRLSLGRIYRDTAQLDFTRTSGLDGTRSDWLIAGQLRLPSSGLDVTSRWLLDEDFSITKSETRANWSNDRLDLASSFIYLPADLEEERLSDVSEWTFDTTYRLNETWSLGLDARYDLSEGAPTRTGLEIGWKNECVTVDFSVSRRFTSSTTLTPSTDFGLSVGLNGFSAGRAVPAGSVHRCTN